MLLKRFEKIVEDSLLNNHILLRKCNFIFVRISITHRSLGQLLDLVPLDPVVGLGREELGEQLLVAVELLVHHRLKVGTEKNELRH